MEHKNIKIFCVDCDGVLSDGKYYVSASGEITKSFNTKDFYGLMMLQNRGVKVILLTSSEDECLTQQIKRLPIECKTDLIAARGISDKIVFMNDRLEENNLTWNNVAYIGDDENDLECMTKSAITGCPADAINKIKEESVFIADNKGGDGAVRGFIDYLIQLTKDSPELISLGLEKGKQL